MTRISNKDKFPVDVEIVGDEYLIGTDSNGKTKTYPINTISGHVVNSIELNGDGIARVINVTSLNLIPYEGSLEEKIAQYINSLELEKSVNDAEIWIEYSEVIPKAITANLSVSACSLEPQTYPDTLYHSGDGEYPQIGDTVYTDLNGTLYALGSCWMGNNAKLQTTEFGVSKTIICK